ncbi:hypothetical protein A2V54_02600 [candidate division WWE3 bacterium RBG_19FT_COMBO_53_11]|uniref:Uncharacterized protein n=1 Tax=candidate division WWE3 bacterium RBG_19FT_COMBO_53_11 TaxID=1802613 RepID=A0A1F4UJ19_UNCKA|nr:MAG: hypothetical protein A2V54_02600 [candidate division WWE3 bacterium RBG_19FT_COMBO_53_11]
MYRPTYLSPRQGTLLGLIWIAVQKNREREQGACVETGLLGDLIFTAQSRGLISPAAHFRFDDASLPCLEAPNLRHALQALKEAGFLHVPETGGTIGFLGTTFFDLPTGVFRYLNVFGFADLVEEFTGGERD